MAIPSLPLQSEKDPRMCAARDHFANLNAFLWTPASLKLASLSLSLKARQFGCQRLVENGCLGAFYLAEADMFDAVCGDVHSSEALPL